MTTPANVQIYASIIEDAVVQFVNADGTTAKVLQAANTTNTNGGSRFDVIGATSSDTASQTFNVLFNNGTIDFPVGQVVIPAGAGTSTVAAVKVLQQSNLSWIDPTGALFLKNGWSLKFALASGAVTAGKTVTFFSCGGGI
jgi:hypothetical protein